MTLPRRRCLIFNPDFPVLGGGERYTVALGDVIGETHEVTYAARNAPDPGRLAQLGFPPLDVQVLQDHDFPQASRGYDLAVVFTMDVPPPSFAGTSLVMVHFPLEPSSSTRVLRHYHCIVNSQFTREWLMRRWGVDGTVVMPPISLTERDPLEKEQLILSVARFMGALGNDWSKRQDVLIDAFSQLPPQIRDSWRLVLAGSYGPSPEMDEFIRSLERQAEGLNVSIETNVTPQRLTDLRDRACLFWHATGFGRPPDCPERAEHFGMATVEAMSHGAIPLVFADGGQPEIVDEQWGRLWHAVPELVDQTTSLLALPPEQLDAMGRKARVASERFGSDRFAREARELLERVGVRHPSTGFAGRVSNFWARLRRRARWDLYRLQAR
jgi:glycosyltransferase involved in cell wall biosynthesis